MSYLVPFVEPRKHYQRLKPEIDGAIIDCLTRGDLIYRQDLKKFEQGLASFVGTKYAVGVNSGYHALHFALLGAGVERGDEVITVAHTFVATISAIIHCGAAPILVDILADYNVDPDAVQRAITKKTKAILPVHLNGRMSEMRRLIEIAERHGIALIEDAAQSLGATLGGRRAGSLGLAGCFSFYPFKILGGFGDGGAITTNDPHVARMASLLRYNGEDRETGEYHYHGQTALLDNVQAAVLSVKLAYLPQWLEHRRKIAALYRNGLEGVGDLRLPHFEEVDRRDVFQNYVIRTKERNGLRTHLKDRGVETLVHWQKPVWEHRALNLGNLSLPETERVCREVVSLPMSAETTEEDVGLIVQAIRTYYAGTYLSVGRDVTKEKRERPCH